MKSRGSRVSAPRSTVCMSSVAFGMWAVFFILVTPWPRFLEPCMSLDGLTACCHHCVPVIRLFGLLNQKPGSVNTSRDNKVEMKWRNQTNVDHCIWETSVWVGAGKISVTFLNPFSPLFTSVKTHRLFFSKQWEKNPYKHLSFVVTGEGSLFQQDSCVSWHCAVFTPTVQPETSVLSSAAWWTLRFRKEVMQTWSGLVWF